MRALITVCDITKVTEMNAKQSKCPGSFNTKATYFINKCKCNVEAFNKIMLLGKSVKV